METTSRILCLSGLLLLTPILNGQDSIDHKAIFPSGISLGYGLGYYSVQDEYISDETYSGTLPHLNLEWIRFHNKIGYRLEFEYQTSGNISNNNISANVMQFVFNQDFAFPVGSFPILSKRVYTYLGPSAQFFYYDIKYNFGQPGTFISPNTFGIIGSLGINGEFIFPVNEKLRIEGLLRSNLLSFSGKKIDEYKYEDEPSPTLLSVITATKMDGNIDIRYTIIRRFSATIGYKFDLLRIHKWDPYIAASNSLVLSINYTF